MYKLSATRWTCLAGGLAAVAVVTLLAAKPDDVSKLKSTGSCAGCDLYEATLIAIKAPAADLSGATLVGANLYYADLRGAKLAGALLDRANLQAADLTGATDAVLGNAITDARTTCPNALKGPCK